MIAAACADVEVCVIAIALRIRTLTQPAYIQVKLIALK